MARKTITVTLRPRLVSGSVIGKVVSKANSRRKTNWGGVIKSADALAFEKAVAQQIPHDLDAIDGDVAFIATIYYKDRRPDLDESLVLDCLQQHTDKQKRVWFNGVYVNDRQIKAKLILHELDKDNPRVEFTVVSLWLVQEKLQQLVAEIKGLELL